MPNLYNLLPPSVKELWSIINGAMKPPTVQQFRHNLSELAAHFAGKDDRIRSNTSPAEPNTFSECSTAVMMLTFRPATLGEVHRLLMVMMMMMM